MVSRISKLHDTPPQVQGLYDRGIKSVIPLFKGKSPGYADWQKMSEDEAKERFLGWGERKKKGEGVNYGIRLGPSFGDICDIDLDSEECRRLAPYFLPTTARFGRGGVCTHYLFKQLGRTKVGTRKYQWDKRDEKSVLLEFRASGQTMGPGSVHPVSGEVIEWMSESGVEIFEVEGEDLIRKVDMLAAAALLLRDWQSGGRDELAVCLVGSMLRADWAPDDIDDFIGPILAESGDEERGMRFKASRLAEQLAGDGRVPGLKRLREICSGGGLGTAGFERIVEWLELGGGDIIEEINAGYAVAVLPGGGGVAIMKDAEDSDGVSFMDRSSFSLIYANRSVRVGGRDMTADKFWLGHKDRREYLRGVVFRPGQDVREGEYNLWRGFSVAEAEGGVFGMGWELFHDHIRDEICSGNEEHFKWILGWMAQRVQRPWQVPESSVVLIGERGDGKGSLFKIFGRLFGRHYMTVTQPKHLVGNFNKHLIDKVLVFADEAVWGGDKTNEGVLKTMISEDSRVIEIKGKDAFTVANCTAYGIASNNEWVVPVGRHERRFMILHTRGGVRGDLEYFDRLYAQMSADGGAGSGGGGGMGLGRMLWDLRRLDIGGWRGNQPPRTAGLADQMLAGMEHWVSFLVEYVSSGGAEEGLIWSDRVYEEFIRWSGERGHKHPLARIPFFKNFNKVFVSGERIRRNRGTVQLRSGVVHPGGRDYVYRFLDGEEDIRRDLNTFCGMQMV